METSAISHFSRGLMGNMHTSSFPGSLLLLGGAGATEWRNKSAEHMYTMTQLLRAEATNDHRAIIPGRRIERDSPIYTVVKGRGKINREESKASI